MKEGNNNIECVFNTKKTINKLLKFKIPSEIFNFGVEYKLNNKNYVRKNIR